MSISRRLAERGAGGIFLMVLMFSLVVMAGFAYDGGALFAARREANNVAAAAARSGANQVDQDSLYEGSPVLDEAAAESAAQALVNLSDATFVSADAEGITVEVTVSQSHNMLFLGLLGIDELTVTATSKARLRSAITRDDEG